MMKLSMTAHMESDDFDTDMHRIAWHRESGGATTMRLRYNTTTSEARKCVLILTLSRCAIILNNNVMCLSLCVNIAARARMFLFFAMR